MEDLSKLNNLLIRNGTYYFRVRVPQDLLASIGKKEIKVSLKTKDPREVKSKLALEIIKAEASFKAARRTLPPQPEIPNPTRILAVAAKHHAITTTEIDSIVYLWHTAQELKNAKNDDLLRVSSDPNDAVDIDELLNDYHHFSSNDERENAATIQKVADKIFAKEGISISDQMLELKTYAYQIIKKSLIEQAASSLKRFGHPIEREPFSLFKKAHIQQETITNKINTVETIKSKLLAAKKSDGVTDKSLAGYKLTLDLAMEVFGANRPIESITPEDCREYRDKLSQLPPNAKKKYPTLTLIEAIEKRSKDNTASLSPTSVSGNLKNLRAFFNFAINEGLITKNPATALKVIKPKYHIDAEKRIPFSDNDLQKVFATPIYTGCIDDEHNYNKIGTQQPRRHRFWVPLISLYTGMRLNEICQLFVEDIECIDDIDVIQIRIDKEEIKSLKTKQSMRTIPIHDKLVKIGFLDYVENIRRQGHRELFPHLTKSARNSSSDNFSKWFDRFLKSSNIKKRGLCFHSFRHRFRDECRDADIKEEIVAAIGGWQSGGNKVMNEYGQGDKLKKLQFAINKTNNITLGFTK